MNPELEVRQKRLTRFLCQELLYEFANGGLSPQREQEMRDYISTCRDSQREFEKLKRGHAYAMRASGVRMSPALKEALLNFEPHWQKKLRIWTLWSSQRGWKALPYLVLTLTLAVGLAVFKPWKKTETSDVLLAEQLKTEPDMIAPSTGNPPVSAPLPQASTQVPVEPISANAPPATVTPAPEAAIKPSDPKPVKTAPTAAAKTAEASADDKPSAAPAVGRGFIMRGEIGVEDFENTWPMIRDKIIALGGKVAGNVELGWLRRPDQSYFHFTLPESNYSELELFLGTFGPVRFSKEKHPRVMPEGQIRIILTVKDSITNEGTSASP